MLLCQNLNILKKGNGKPSAKDTCKKSAARDSKGERKESSPRKKPGKQGAKKTSASIKDKKEEDNSGKAKPNNNLYKFSQLEPDVECCQLSVSLVSCQGCGYRVNTPVLSILRGVDLPVSFPL